MKRMIPVVFLLLFVSCSKEQPVQSEMPTKQLNAIITIDTNSKKLRLIDEEGKEAGTVKFESDTYVIELVRYKR